MKIKVLINFNEFLKCNLLIARKTFRNIFVSLVIICLCCVFVALINSDLRSTILIVLAVVVLFIIIVFISLYVIIKKQFESTPILKQEVTYGLTAAEIETHGDSFNSKISWETFIKAEEFKDYFLLYTSPASAFIFPLRCFESDVQVTEFRELLRRKLNGKLND